MNTNKLRSQGTDRKTAISVGVLFIVATVLGVLGKMTIYRSSPGCSGLSYQNFCK